MSSNNSSKFGGFLEHLHDNNLMTTVIITILSSIIMDLGNTFMDSVIFPIINHNGKNVKKKNINDYTIKIRGVPIGIGKVIVSVVRFIIFLYIAYIIIDILKNVSKK